MQKIRAKFAVTSIHEQYCGLDKDKKTSTIHTVELQPIYSSDSTGENKAFWDATPTGKLTMTLTNKTAIEHFTTGKEFYLDFIPVE